MLRKFINTQILKILSVFILFIIQFASFAKDNDIQITTGYHIPAVEITDVKQAALLSYTDMPDNLISLGFQQHPVWIKVNFHHLETANPYKFLVLTPPRHEDVQLYQVSRDKRYVRSIESLPSIEKVSFFGESQKNIFLLGNINADSDYFLQVQSFGPMNINLELKNADDLESDFHRRVFSLGGAVYSAFIFLLLICFLFHINREIIYVHFFLHVLATILVFITTLGFSIRFLKTWFDWDLSLQLGAFMILNISSSLLLFSNILKLMNLPAWLGKYIYYIPALNLVFLPWFVIADSQNAWFYSTVFGTICCLVYGVSFLKFFDKRVPAQWVLAIFSSVIYLLLLLILMALLGHIQFSNNVLQLNVLRIGFLPIMFGLIFWFYEVIKRHRMVEIEIEKAAESLHLQDEIQRRKAYEGFMGMLVHEIKTPLSIIQIASISLGRRFAMPSNEAQRIAHIDKSVNDINDILYKCVQVSDIENNTVFVDKSRIVVEDMNEELRSQLKSERITWDCPPGIKVFTDYILLRTILSNLLTNALKYSDPSSQILFYCSQLTVGDKQLVRFSVINVIGAAGTPDPKLVFERYYRGTHTSSMPGTGLGLWLSQSIANVIQSFISMEVFEDRISFSIELEAVQ
jgi:signal transduction histidine kinase